MSHDRIPTTGPSGEPVRRPTPLPNPGADPHADKAAQEKERERQAALRKIRNARARGQVGPRKNRAIVPLVMLVVTTALFWWFAHTFHVLEQIKGWNAPPQASPAPAVQGPADPATTVASPPTQESPFSFLSKIGQKSHAPSPSESPLVPLSDPRWKIYKSPDSLQEKGFLEHDDGTVSIFVSSPGEGAFQFRRRFSDEDMRRIRREVQMWQREERFR
ncbi:hypothetical protein Pla8534_53950 [Lignipirellula cremea]|uniref:Uncharacterized protein n=1 Tax=Lignipirellula cremea TaxID=2528010 RepID=A0A518E0D4_9BACT|nr:hypothetical protein Pla8534_53950 [Lignipirellula cremea]